MIVNKTSLLVLTLFLSPFAGCMTGSTSNTCPEESCFPLTSAEFDDLVSNWESFDVLNMALENERLRVRSTLVQDFQGNRGEIHWDVAKDEQAGLRYVSTRYIVSGNTIIDTEVIDGGNLTNIRSGSAWFEGRDENPSFTDPFFELAKSATENPDGLWPPFSFNTSQLSGLSWEITGDEASSQQVATASNESHDFFISVMGEKPQIMSIEIVSGDDYEFSLVVSKGDEVQIELQNNLPRVQMPFVPPNPSLISKYGDTTVIVSTVPDDFSHEAKLSEIEIHSVSGDTTFAKMNLSSEEQNITLLDGTWWEFIWVDITQKGLFSPQDSYYVRTNSTSDFQIRFYDNWSESWTDASL